MFHNWGNLLGKYTQIKTKSEFNFLTPSYAFKSVNNIIGLQVVHIVDFGSNLGSFVDSFHDQQPPLANIQFDATF